MSYAWIIDRDHLSDSGMGDDKGVIGPRGARDSLVAELADGKGLRFRMFDDDGDLYYSGRIVYGDGSDCGDFEPLDDYGMPNAGCTEIHYLERGVWTQV